MSSLGTELRAFVKELKKWSAWTSVERLDAQAMRIRILKDPTGQGTEVGSQGLTSLPEKYYFGVETCSASLRSLCLSGESGNYATHLERP